MKAVTCENTGCSRAVLVDDPLAPVVCGYCAFWRLRGRPVELYAPLGHNRLQRDLYYIDPDDDVLLARAPITTLHVESAGIGPVAVTTHRLRCIGLAPWYIAPEHITEAVFEKTPNAPLGVRA